jgi:glycosyl-4,4'-diaponeurosporenoate acyltransferase
MPPVEVSRPVMVMLNVGFWGGWSALAGYIAHRRRLGHFERETWLSRLRSFEAGGRFYERRLRIQRWKGRLPEAGALFTGGFSKRSLRSRRRELLERFVAETRRAEWAHWLIVAGTPVTFLWNWWWVDVVMVLYAVAANGPCLVTQRYNRARLLRILA